jgi:hypothetical protein
MASELYVETLKGLTSGANANKVIIPSGQTLDASAGSVVLPAGAGGKVLNVYQDTSESTKNTSSTSFVAHGLSVTLTPVSASSKFVMFLNTTGDMGSAQGVLITFYRDSTNLGHVNNGFGGMEAPYRGQTGMQYMDSPNTTNQITYAVYYRSRNGGTVELPPWQMVETFIVMEIAG